MFPPPQELQGRVRVATYLGDDGNKRAETTVFDELDQRCASELTSRVATPVKPNRRVRHRCRGVARVTGW